VWTKGKKIASIGVHVRQWVTAHGFAINVTNDLGDFDLIVPCGISGVEMTSVARELGDTLAAQRLDGSAEDLWRLTVDAVGTAFAGVFGLDPEPAKLDLLLAPGTDERTSAY
jgi:lipoate-protein ligase B